MPMHEEKENGSIPELFRVKEVELVIKSMKDKKHVAQMGDTMNI